MVPEENGINFATQRWRYFYQIWSMVLESVPLSVGEPPRPGVWHACCRPFTPSKYHINLRVSSGGTLTSGWGRRPGSGEHTHGDSWSPRTLGNNLPTLHTPWARGPPPRPPSRSKPSSSIRIRGRPVPINHLAARCFTSTSPPTTRQVHCMKLEAGSEEWS